MAIMDSLRSLWRSMSGPSVISPEEIEGVLHLPVLAIIPHLERRKFIPATNGSHVRRIDLEGRWRSRLLTNFSEKSAAAVAYQALVKDLVHRSRETRQKVWLLTSGVAGEGT